MHPYRRTRNRRRVRVRLALDAILSIRRLLCMVAGVLVLGACDAQHPSNAPIATQDLTKGYRLQRVKDELLEARGRMMREGKYEYKPAPRGPQPCGSSPRLRSLRSRC